MRQCSVSGGFDRQPGLGTKVAPAAGMRSSDTLARQGPHGRVRLLLVEDELSTVFAMREFFAHAGYDVDCASDPGDAVALLDRRPYDAVITDLHLTTHRDGEGLEIASHARRYHPHACIVMLTAYATDATAEEAARRGVDLYQTKPVELGELSAFVDVTLHRDREPGDPGLRWSQH